MKRLLRIREYPAIMAAAFNELEICAANLPGKITAGCDRMARSRRCEHQRRRGRSRRQIAHVGVTWGYREMLLNFGHARPMRRTFDARGETHASCRHGDGAAGIIARPPLLKRHRSNRQNMKVRHRLRAR
jgi:hypothetical protein